jgi:glutamate-5-semialdehyde dehydrogenase
MSSDPAPDGGQKDVVEVRAACARARAASRVVRGLTTEVKDAVLLAMADRLTARAADVVRANQGDLRAGRQAGLAPGLLDRLRLDEPRLAEVARSLRQVARLADPVGEVVRGQRLPNGLEVRQTRVPMGVVAMVYEARPNVTVDAAGLSFKAGNAVVLRGGSAASGTNRALVAMLRDTLTEAGLPADAVTLLDGGGREVVHT